MYQVVAARGWTDSVGPNIIFVPSLITFTFFGGVVQEYKQTGEVLRVLDNGKVCRIASDFFEIL